MIVAVASGKGGTGKTTVAVSLALSRAAGQGDRAAGPLLFLDCDVEEPNAALFLRPQIEERRRVGVLVPQVDAETCTYCGRCAEVCQYNAIAVVRQQVLVFPELCHGCGSCHLICPVGAIDEVLNASGVIERGRTGEIVFGQGIMDVGQVMAPPIIRQLKQWMLDPQESERTVIIDAPPGTACPVVESLQGADFVLMVTEPTPFGLHDLRLAVEVARDEMGLPVGVVVNRDGVGDQTVDAYCQKENIPILMRIPLERRIAEAYSDGVPLVETLPEYGARFDALWEQMAGIVAERGGV